MELQSNKGFCIRDISETSWGGTNRKIFTPEPGINSNFENILLNQACSKIIASELDMDNPLNNDLGPGEAKPLFRPADIPRKGMWVLPPAACILSQDLRGLGAAASVDAALAHEINPMKGITGNEFFHASSFLY